MSKPLVFVLSTTGFGPRRLSVAQPYPLRPCSPPVFVNASHAARWVACRGVRSHPVPVALVGGVFHPSRVERRLRSARRDQRSMAALSSCQGPSAARRRRATDGPDRPRRRASLGVCRRLQRVLSRSGCAVLPPCHRARPTRAPRRSVDSAGLPRHVRLSPCRGASG
jgi:hypothetical protein